MHHPDAPDAVSGERGDRPDAPGSALSNGDTRPTHPFVAAFLSGDLDAIAATLADDVELDSPVISTRLRGKAEVMELLGQVRLSVTEPSVSDELRSGSTVMLAFRARAGRQKIQGVHLLRLDEHGLIREFTVQMRPLAGLTAFAAEIGPRLARRHRARRSMLRLMARPLATLTAAADPIAAHLALGRHDR